MWMIQVTDVISEHVPVSCDDTSQFMLAEGKVRRPKFKTALHFCNVSESQQMECFSYADEYSYSEFHHNSS